MDIVTVNGLSFAYGGGRRVISSMHFRLSSAETVAVIGKSGCGKTTFLHLLSGLLVAKEGKVTAPERTRTAMVFQDARLLPWMNVQENVRLAIRRENKQKADERIARMLERVGLSGFAHYYPGELSGGMAQRVSLARALITGPELLLMDEPFGALDAITRGMLQEDFLALKRASRLSAVLVTHDVREAVRLADRVLVMAQGAFCAEHEVKNLPAGGKEEVVQAVTDLLRKLP